VENLSKLNKDQLNRSYVNVNKKFASDAVVLITNNAMTINNSRFGVYLQTFAPALLAEPTLKKMKVAITWCAHIVMTNSAGSVVISIPRNIFLNITSLDALANNSKMLSKLTHVG